MANISQINLPNNTSYDIVSRQTRGLFRGVIDSTSTSTAFTATVPGITELYDGLMVVLKNSVVASASGVKLNINGLGEKALFTSNRNATVTTHWTKNTECLLYYDATNSRWVMYQGYYVNTIGEYGGGILAGSRSIFKYALALKITQDRWESVVLSSSTATSKTKNPNGFLITSPMLYVNNGTYTEGQMVPQTNAWTTSYAIDSRYSTNGTSSWATAGNSFYLVGTINDAINKFFLANTWWADQLPSTEDGLYYWYVGQFYDTYRYSLHPYHPIFYYKNGEIKQYFPNTFEKSKYGIGTLEAGIRPLVDQARANRLAFLPADQIIIEKTTDGGNTWEDAEVSDTDKKRFFSSERPLIYLPRINDERSELCGIRFTITGMKYNVPVGTSETEKYNFWNSNYVSSTERYFNVRQWWFWISAAEDRIGVQIYCATGANPNNWVTVFNEDFRMQGRSGSDWIRVGNGKTFGGGYTQTSNYWNWKIVFWSKTKENETEFTGSNAQSVAEFRCYGDNVWTTSNNFMRYDHLYTWNMNKDVTFPAQVTATKFNGTATNATTVNNHTVESDVPPNLGGTIVVAQTQPINQNIGDVWLEISTT